MSSTEIGIITNVATQLPIVVLFVMVIFKLQDRFDKIQTERDKSFIAALEKLNEKFDAMANALKNHDDHVDERVNKLRRRSTDK